MSSAFTSPRFAPRRGFALLITITLVAFLVLILVALASLTRVETQVASNSQQHDQARQNALMALNIAIGQLQKYAGPDQRVTATADFAGTAAGDRVAAGGSAANTSSLPAPDGSRGAVPNGISSSASVQLGTRYWTGVWGNQDAASDLYKQSPAPVLLNWLVSGNENSPTFTTDSSGRITGNSIATTFRPSMTVTPALTPAVTVDTSLTINSTDAVLLVGPNSAGAADAAAPDRYVAAPLVNIESTGIPGLAATDTATIGRYAYWVGDEGVKAKYNLVDPYASFTSPTDNSTLNFTTSDGGTLFTTHAALARYRLMSAPRNGIEGLAGLSYQANDAKVDRVVDPEQMLLAGASVVTADDQQRRIHDVTTRSMGVLANTQEGGLRTDLTAPLNNTALLNATLGSGNKIIPAAYSPSQGPNWGLLRSYQVLATSAPGASVNIRRASSTQMGVFPIVSDVRLLFGLKPETDNPVDYSTTRAQALFNPLVVLTNPYNRPLRLTGTLDMEFKATEFAGSTPFTDEGRGQLYLVGMRDGGGVARNYSVLSRLRANGTQMQNPSLLNNVKFRFPDVVIQPGQSQVFSITANQMDVGDNPTLTAGLPGSFNYYGKTIQGLNLGSDPANPSATPTYHIEDFGNSTAVDIVFSIPSGVVKQLRAIDMDYQGGGNADRKGQAFAAGMFKANVNYPGDSTPATNEKNFNRTLRPFADFNLRAAHNRRLRYLFTVPPYYNRWLPVGGTAANQVPTEFTSDLSLGAYWGRSTTAAGGLREARFFDLPTPPVSGTEMSLLSLAQLQHADLTADDDDIGVGHQPGYAVGNSFSPPYLTRDQTKQQLNDWYSVQIGGAFGEESHNYYDISYLLNCALWDKYFFSAIPQTATNYESVNPRYRFVPDATLAAANPTAKATVMHDPAQAARYLMVNGAFNINSTSIEGWKAVLGGTRGLNMPGDTQVDAAFPRSVHQPGVATVPAPSGDGDDTYTGFRRLNDTQLTNLATEIVKQVRLRGPFVSLAQFVNRTLTTTSASLALQGPLQTAIDSAGGINTFTSPEAAPANDKVAIQSAGSQGEEDGGSQAVVGTFGIFPNSTPPPANEQGYRSTATPGWLTQADLLQVIGPALSTRSDTFVIRTYGDVKNPLDVNAPPLARAWCEATVQRLPDYVNPGDSAEVAPASLTQADNQTLGRRFEVVSFRWLSPNDI